MDRGSFTTQTDAATHDSDPRLLNFERLSLAPDDQTGEGKIVETLGKTLDLSSIGTGDIPAFNGPTIADLTGGTGNFIDTIRHLSDPSGIITLTITTLDSNTETITLDVGTLKTLAIAQGLMDTPNAQLDITTLFTDVSGTFGANTINTVSWNNPTDLFLVDNGTVISMTGILTIMDGSGIQQNIANINYQTSGSNGPGIGQATNENPSIKITVSINSNGPNTATAVLAPPLTNNELTGIGDAEISFTLDDSSVVGPFPLTAATLRANAISTAQGDNLTYLGDTSVFGWDLSSLIGHTVVSASVNLVTTFTAGFLISPSSSITISWNNHAVQFSFQPGIAPTVIPEPFAADGWGLTQPLFIVEASWGADPSLYVDVTVPLDAASIIADASPGDLTSQSAVIGNGASLFVPFLGYVVQGVTANIVGGYGPTTVPPTNITLLYGQSGFVGGIGLIQPIGVSDFAYTAGSVPGTRVAAQANITTIIDLFPKSTPEIFGSQVITEPYELRQRNLPAFKFRFRGTIPETPPSINVGCFVSQGDPIVTTDNSHREWTTCPVDVISAPAQKEVAFPLNLSVDQQTPNMPENFSGVLLIVPKEFTGPWNYIRFTISLPDGEESSALNGITLEITANAREVI